MKNLLKVLIAIIGCELVGILGTVFTFSAIPNWYNGLTKPFFAPPNWIFGPVWTVLYALMGISVYLIWQLGPKKKKVRTALTFFFAQLALNFFWTPIFFGLKAPLLALFVIICMWIMIGFTIKTFYALSKYAAYLLVPYLLWVTFAMMLNAAIVLLN
jgi:tryptophan-rich sensory protein